MSKPLTDAELGTLLFLMKGNRDALQLCLDVIYCGQIFDDFVDRDREYTKDEVLQTFVKAFRSIPNNPWFVSLPERYRWQLEGLLISAAMQYRDSTKLEMGNEDERFSAFIIRNSVMALIHYVIYLCGGDAWVDENGPLLWRTISLREEYEQFKLEGGHV